MNTNRLMIGATLALVMGILAVNATIHFTTKETVSATVTGKERITKGWGNNASSQYLIFTDTETFTNKDSLYALKYNSSDLYGSLRENMTCEFTVVGFRVGFLSMYRNIIEADCEQQGE